MLSTAKDTNRSSVEYQNTYSYGLTAVWQVADECPKKSLIRSSYQLSVEYGDRKHKCTLPSLKKFMMVHCGAFVSLRENVTSGSQQTTNQRSCPSTAAETEPVVDLVLHQN